MSIFKYVIFCLFLYDIFCEETIKEKAEQLYYYLSTGNKVEKIYKLYDEDIGFEIYNIKPIINGEPLLNEKYSYLVYSYPEVTFVFDINFLFMKKREKKQSLIKRENVVTSVAYSHIYFTFKEEVSFLIFEKEQELSLTDFFLGYKAFEYSFKKYENTIKTFLFNVLEFYFSSCVSKFENENDKKFRLFLKSIEELDFYKPSVKSEIKEIRFLPFSYQKKKDLYTYITSGVMIKSYFSSTFVTMVIDTLYFKSTGLTIGKIDFITGYYDKIALTKVVESIFNDMFAKVVW